MIDNDDGTNLTQPIRAVLVEIDVKVSIKFQNDYLIRTSGYF